jgi:hypothetical protein
MRGQLIRGVLAGALALSAATAAHADVSVRLSNAQLTARSEIIVVGRVVAAESRWVDRTLVTAVTVRIEESLKGGASGDMEVILPGGADANRRIKVAMTFPGAPTMQAGERVFLFVSYDTDVAGYVISGFAQGKFSIFTDARGEPRVARDLRGSQLVEGSGIARGTATSASLAEFRQEIAGLVAQP